MGNIVHFLMILISATQLTQSTFSFFYFRKKKAGFCSLIKSKYILFMMNFFFPQKIMISKQTRRQWKIYEIIIVL